MIGPLCEWEEERGHNIPSPEEIRERAQEIRQRWQVEYADGHMRYSEWSQPGIRVIPTLPLRRELAQIGEV